MAESDKTSITLVLSIIAVLLSIVALVLVVVSLSQKGTNNFNIDAFAGQAGYSQQSGSANDDDKIWTMAIGHEASRNEYLDEVSGQIKGFDVDIVNAVCKIANKNCRWSADVYTRCWNSEVGQAQRGGEGIFASYYDACTAWAYTHTRVRTFQFSKPFTKSKTSVFVVKPGNPLNFDWRDLTGKKIGFIDGFFSDESCVARQADSITGAVIPPENIVHYHGRDEFIAGVIAEEVAAGYDSLTTYYNTDVLDIISPEFSCTIGGQAMMMRKDSRMADWWNPALERLLGTSEYRTICNDLLEQHGHFPGPHPEDHCIGL